ncbi:DUF2975 domain-containing protein [Altererythrobacter sp. KTW20L]|uniref:DUF2975 domain-containing protein n=1 Tax=Altererythrobacter sp. KTW20L TaxID=2942210 RepID=UPI0020BDB3DE|nr:DUF2975 domain-containing protein [Altererythrobacter sp. KTW20L]MCL6249747.1 DUF2975 domain-containing protein [Altererythrobacter sp. KTW20L]
MQSAAKDPLLMIAKIGTIIVRILLVIGQIGLGIAIAMMLLGTLGYLPDEVTVVPDSDLSSLGLWLGVLAMIALIVSLGLMYDFVRLLARMIDTVADGDPFVMANAARLTRMAWLSLGAWLVGWVANALGKWGEAHRPPSEFRLDVEFSLTGVGIAILLFILARVFREGAKMREELEGTV